MDRQSLTTFIVIYTIAGLLLLVQIVRDYRQGHSWKRIGKDLIPPISIIIGSLILWYAMAATDSMLDAKFNF